MIKNKKFLLKQISSEEEVVLDSIKVWSDIPYDLPFQNIVNCYGVVCINQINYIVSDYIEDNTLLPHQIALINRLENP